MYDEAKRFSEALTMAYLRYHKVDTHIVRIFNTYGPRLQVERRSRDFKLHEAGVARRRPYRLWRGSQTRSFCYVSDEIEGILRLAKSDEHLPTNIGNPNEFTILECAKRVLEVTGIEKQNTYEPLPQDDPKQRRPDISKAKRLLGWEPKIQLEEGLKMSLDYFKGAVKKLAVASK